MYKNISSLQIRSEQVEQIYKNTLSSSFTSIIAASLLSYIQWPVIAHDIILIWLTCMLILTVIRVISVLAFFRIKPGLTEIKFWERLSVTVMFFAATTWSAAGIFLFPEGNFERQAGTIVMLAGLSAGAAAALSALRQPAMIFIPFAMVPLTIHLFTEASSVTSSLAIMCLIYTVFLLLTAERNYKTLRQNISMRIQSRLEGKIIRKSEERNVKTVEILRKIASGEPAEKIFDAIALLYESHHPGLRCSMLIMQGNKLLHGGAPSLPEAYCQAIHGLECGPDTGSCGTSTYTGKRVIVEDIATDPKWSKLKNIALQHGLRSCWSEPIKDSAGRVMGAFGMYYDHPAVPTEEELSDLEAAARLAAIVMEREEREKQLQQKHKMEAVGYMAGGMAHNFNNNLAIILGNLELAQLKQNGNTKAVSLLENAKTAVFRSRDLVNQIITYSRKGSHEKTPMQLLSIVNETVSLLHSTLPSTIKIETASSPDCTSTFIHADASQIQEIIINLCKNSIHAMNEKGVLKIFLEAVELTQKDIPAQDKKRPGLYAKLSVQDSGCGIPSPMLDKIFDPFFTTKEEFEGAGMGLATVQGIVAQHDGIITIDSFPGAGTTFSLYFPVIEHSQVAESAPQNATFPAGSERILNVDDDPLLATLGEAILKKGGYDVTTATDSIAALKLFTANPDAFDLVITDQTMPDLTGQELIQKIKQIRSKIPVIICTGYSNKIDHEKANKIGVNAFFMKPLDMNQLLQTVRQVLDEGKKQL